MVGNPYISDFLDRLRVQTWMYAVPATARRPDARGRAAGADHRDWSTPSSAATRRRRSVSSPTTTTTPSL